MLYGINILINEIILYFDDIEIITRNDISPRRNKLLSLFIFSELPYSMRSNRLLVYNERF